MRVILGRALNAYSASLQKRPYTTQIVSSAALWALGDVLAQRIGSPHGSSLDAKRLAMTTTYGGLFAGIVSHTWYLELDKYARRISIPSSPRFIAAKVLADTFLFGPIHVAAFFTLLTIGEGGNLKDVKEKLQADFVPTFGAELAFWPAIQVLNFKFVPLQYQLLVVNAVTIGDAAFISWAQHHEGWFEKILQAFERQKEGRAKAVAVAHK